MSEMDVKKESALMDLARSTESLYYHYKDAERRAADAMTAMIAGKMPEFSYSGAFGALGHQLPFDITSNTERVNSAAKIAKLLGATDEEIVQTQTEAVQRLKRLGL